MALEHDPALNELRTHQNTLRDALEHLDAAKQQLKTIHTLLQPVLDPLRDTVKEAEDTVATAEAALRTQLLAYYIRTGNRVAPEIGEVKQHTEVTFDPPQALAWALEHGVCLTLDVAAFKKYCLTQSILPAGVEVTKTWQPHIARKTL